MQLELKRNLGTIDRIIRVTIAFLLFFLIYTKMLTGLWATVAGIILVFQLIEASLGY